MDIDKLVDNKLLTLAGRLAIIAATAVFLPLAGGLMVRVLNAANSIATKVDDTAVKMQLLEQSVKFGFDGNKTEIGAIRNQLNDHEGRIRVIERAPAVRTQP